MNLNTGFKFALPSESQWEYACRAGESTTYCGSNDLDSVGWYRNNSSTHEYPITEKNPEGCCKDVHEVAGKHPNARGLYDMSGNVWEWTQDCWHSNYLGAPADGSAWENADCKDEGHVVKGGAFRSAPEAARAARRSSGTAFGPQSDDGMLSIGFRIVRTLP